MEKIRFISCRSCRGVGLVYSIEVFERQVELPKGWKERVSWSGVGYPDVYHLCSECLREEEEDKKWQKV